MNFRISATIGKILNFDGHKSFSEGILWNLSDTGRKRSCNIWYSFFFYFCIYFSISDNSIAVLWWGKL